MKERQSDTATRRKVEKVKIDNMDKAKKDQAWVKGAKWKKDQARGGCENAAKKHGKDDRNE